MGAGTRARLLAATTLTERFEDLAGVTTAIVEGGDGPPVLVGHLLGGAIAARYAVEHARRLTHLVLVDTLGLGWYRPAPRFAVPMVRFLARPTEQSRDRLFHECFVDFDRVGRNFGEQWEDLRAYALDRARQPAGQAALRALRAALAEEEAAA